MSEALRFVLGMGLAVLLVFVITYTGAALTDSHILATCLFCILGWMLGIYVMLKIIDCD